MSKLKLVPAHRIDFFQSQALLGTHYFKKWIKVTNKIQ